MTKGDWQDDLVSAITTGNSVYCGKSAGAILAGRTVETATWKVCYMTAIVGCDVVCIVLASSSFTLLKGLGRSFSCPRNGDIR